MGKKKEGDDELVSMGNVKEQKGIMKCLSIGYTETIGDIATGVENRVGIRGNSTVMDIDPTIGQPDETRPFNVYLLGNACQLLSQEIGDALICLRNAGEDDAGGMLSLNLPYGVVQLMRGDGDVSGGVAANDSYKILNRGRFISGKCRLGYRP